MGRADVGIGPYAPIFHLFGFLFSPLSPSIGIVNEEFLTKCGRFGHPANFLNIFLTEGLTKEVKDIKLSAVKEF